MPYKRIWEETHREEEKEGERAIRVLERLCDRNEPIGRDEMLALLEVSNGREIHSRLGKLFVEISSEGGIDSDEAMIRRGEGRRSTWSRGPRCAQALHAARMSHRTWGIKRNRGGEMTITDVAPDAPGAKLVVRGWFCDGDIVEFKGGRGTLLEALEDETLVGEWRSVTPEEVWIERIEPGEGKRAQEVPFGYEENGVWVRGRLDHTAGTMPDKILDDADRTLYAYVQEIETFERTVALDEDVTGQVDEIRTRSKKRSEVTAWWRPVKNGKPRSVRWISTSAYTSTPRWAPPFEMRARCWRDVTIRAANGTRAKVSVESMRGDDARTCARAIARWRARDRSRTEMEVEVEAVEVAREQPGWLEPERVW